MLDFGYYNMDCLEGMALIDDMRIDLTITSPPYDDLRTYNGYSFDFENIAKELYRITKIGGVVVWIVNDAVKNGSETGTSFRQALRFMEIGFNLHDTMIWEKDTMGLPCKSRYGQCFEYMFVFSKGKIKTANKISDRKNKYSGSYIHGTTRAADGTTFRKSNDKKTVIKEYGERFNIWNVPSEKNNKTCHPAVFPEQLANDHIISWSNEGDIVLDPFMGSGTTAISARRNRRNFIGFEISKEYYEEADKRYKSETSQMNIYDFI